MEELEVHHDIDWDNQDPEEGEDSTIMDTIRRQLQELKELVYGA